MMKTISLLLCCFALIGCKAKPTKTTAGDPPPKAEKPPATASATETPAPASQPAVAADPGVREMPPKRKAKPKPKPKAPAYLRDAMVNPRDNPALPNVLLIGDSISIGYTVPVRHALLGKADVFRPRTNCAHSGVGVSNMKRWLGKRKWHVIHFNFGIWDSHYLRNGRLVRARPLSKEKMAGVTMRYTTEQYVENLTKILAILKQTDAKLIWAVTTPVTRLSPARVAAYREKRDAAAKLMRKESVIINDLHALALPNLKQWQRKDGCHFLLKGSRALAAQVAATVTTALGKNHGKNSQKLH